MSIVNKPNMANIWAKEGNILTPTPEKALIGWEEEIPPYELANFVENRQDEGIAYILQEGIAEWDSITEYREGSYTKYQGLVYKSILDDNINKNPSTVNTFWVLAFDEAGSAAAVEEEVNKIKGQDGYLTYYLRKSDPILSVPMKAPSYQASVGLSGGYKFGGSVANNTTGMVLNSGNLEFVIAGGVVAKLTPTMDINSNDSTIVTTAMLRSVILDFCFPVGCIHITEQNYNPNSKFGGSWELTAKGMSLVGRNDGVTSDIPDWTKTAGSEFGEYEHQLTEPELPKVSPRLPHTNGDFSNPDFADEVEQASWIPDAALNRAIPTDTLLIDNGWGRSKRDAAFIGNDEGHNNVQPSKVFNVWKRVG